MVQKSNSRETSTMCICLDIRISIISLSGQLLCVFLAASTLYIYIVLVKMQRAASIIIVGVFSLNVNLLFIQAVCG